MRPRLLKAAVAAIMTIISVQSASATTVTAYTIEGGGKFRYNQETQWYGSKPSQPASLSFWSKQKNPMSVSNTLPDFNANADYSLTAYLNLNGCTLFHGSIDLGTTNLASLMQDPFIGKAVGYLQNAPAVGEGAFGTSWGTFSYDYTASSGLYGAGSDINFNASLTDNSSRTIASILGDSDYYGKFEFGLTLEATDVQAVPVPAALPLMLGAVGIFGFMGRRRKLLA